MIFKEGVLDVASSKLPRVVVLVGFPQARTKVLKRCSFSLNIATFEFTHIPEGLLMIFKEGVLDVASCLGLPYLWGVPGPASKC